MRWKVSEQVVYEASDAYAFIKHIGRRLQEDFVVLHLNAKHRVVGKPVLIARGTASSVEIHPRDVFRDAIKRNATEVILAHNHPSGSVEPSHDDKQLTCRLVEAGKLLGIPVLDHLVIVRDRFISLAERGEL